MNLFREKEAIKAYLKMLESKGARAALLHQRSLFLDKLSLSLDEKNADGQSYRFAVEAVIDTIDVDDWHNSLTAAREFYPFWMSDINAIVALSKNPGFDLMGITWRPQAVQLNELWAALDGQKFETAETWPLKAYTKALRDEAIEQSIVDTRIKIAKLILIRLRDAPDKTPKIYRIAVDSTLPLFHIKENRRLFLVVVREFFHFWIGNPDAHQFVLKNESGNMLL
ncbi:MAG: hypothetical protein HOP21_08330 [Methylotenera sp.]|nr:hypothetical protein [Methylotenera sp.]